jgi:hypothetical protein
MALPADELSHAHYLKICIHVTHGPPGSVERNQRCMNVSSARRSATAGMAQLYGRQLGPTGDRKGRPAERIFRCTWRAQSVGGSAAPFQLVWPDGYPASVITW